MIRKTALEKQCGNDWILTQYCIRKKIVSNNKINNSWEIIDEIKTKSNTE
jgi:hypothetical protein